MKIWQGSKKAISAFLNLLGLCVLVCVFSPEVVLAQGFDLVLVYVTSAEPDVQSPWRINDVTQDPFVGVPLDSHRILVNAEVAGFAAQIELRKVGESERVLAKVETVDYEIGLALLSVTSTHFWDNIKAATIGDEVPLDSRVELFRVSPKHKIVSTNGRIAEIGEGSALHSTYPIIRYVLKTDDSDFDGSEPVVAGGKIVAVASHSVEGIVYGIPAPIIRRFVADASDRDYRGFPELGLKTSDLISPRLRALLNAPNLKHGVRITEVAQHHPLSSVIKADDILTAINDVKIDDLGKIWHPLWKRIEFQYVINKLHSGDQVALEFWRDGKKFVKMVVLPSANSNDARIPVNRYRTSYNYAIVGGFVFHELTYDYLRSWGSQWPRLAPSYLVYLSQHENSAVKEGAEGYVVLSRVLGDEFNRGYDDLENLTVDAVDGQPVSSWQDFISKIELAESKESEGQQFLRVSFRNGAGTVVLDLRELGPANERIAKKYHLPESSVL